MNLIDEVIKPFSPEKALKRARARHALRAYEAAKPSRVRKLKRDRGSGDSVMHGAGEILRIQARHLDENHDLAKGILDTLTANVIGRGLGIEPQVKRPNGELHTEMNEKLRKLFGAWSRAPEVTREHHLNGAFRLLARSWLRDGEVLVQHVEGTGPTLQHGTDIPYSFEMVEADLLPYDLNDPTVGVVQGVRKNGWRRPISYFLLKDHPGSRFSFASFRDAKEVEADRIIHLKTVGRIAQTRGITIFASVIARLEDIKEYEESERIAARIAAAMCAFIKKNDDLAEPTGEVNPQGQREISFEGGIIFDDLRPGEDVGMIDTQRPNTSLEAFRNGQLRAAAAGVGVSYSSVSRNYNGTYSAQRQELVEQSVHYQTLRDHFIENCARPIYERWMRMVLLSGSLGRLQGVDLATLSEAHFVGPVMPWIDPLKEAKANIELNQLAAKSLQEIIRERGGNPTEVMAQIEDERKELRKRGIVSSGDPSTINKSSEEHPDDEEGEEGRIGSNKAAS